MAALLVALAFADLASGPSARLPQPELTTLAAASPRPAECRQTVRRDSVRADIFWERARLPRIRKYCDTLAWGYTRLGSAPAEALAAASRAERIQPGRAATLVLRARALFHSGRADAASATFDKALSVSARSLETPAALHDFARTALQTAHYPEALAAYRKLVARVGLFDSPLLKQRVYVEAAGLAMWSGPQGLDEAIAYLGEARRLDSGPGLDGFIVASLALALDRQGRPQEALGVLAEANGRFTSESISRNPQAPDLLPGELEALTAILLEEREPALARAAWLDFQKAQPNSRWTAHARAKVERLRSPQSRATR
jgi:tetratricopeptide (TPR) repeat protein